MGWGDRPHSAINTFRSAGIYTVKVTHSTGCISFLTQRIEMPKPTVMINGSPVGCGRVDLEASGGISYVWNGGETPFTAANSFRESGVYNVSVTGVNGCISISSVNVTILEPKLVSLKIISDSPGSICFGTEVNFSAIASNGGATPSFVWNKNGFVVGTGSSFSSKELRSNDVITCEVTSSETCVSALTALSNEITILVSKPIEVIMEEELITTASKPIQINPSVIGDVVSYFWSPSDRVSDPKIRNPILNPLKTTNYTLQTISTNGCISFSKLMVKVRAETWPNAFSPNGDGVNDYWNIDISGYPGATVSIYNRYGMLVFHSKDPNISWDGHFNHRPLPKGTYFYRLLSEGNDLKPVSGSITIL